MKYIYDDFEDQKTWIEIDDEYFAIRQIVMKIDNKIFVSCRDDCLAEGSMVDTIDNSEKISKDTFEQLLEKYTADMRKK